jgi:enamine deaminase RidA (YjgF/YER057c/UK114 family)
MARKLVSSGSAVEPITGFSRAVRVGNQNAIGGTAPLEHNGETVAPGDPAGQTRRCIEIIHEALEKAGASLSDFVRTWTILTRIEDWEDVARVPGAFFGHVRPVITIMQVISFIDLTWRVEIEADAVINSRTT